jgi:flagellar hook-basal body complex protein FliE
MSPIGSVPSALSAVPINPAESALLKSRLGAAPAAGLHAGKPEQGFGAMIDGLVATVDAKQGHANEMTRRVLLGETDKLHHSVIAMQEAGVAFGLMVEVRNKLVESYQELMRMQV